MKLYLVRHGAAHAGGVDSERRLTDEGRADITRLAALLARAGVRVERVVHSGKQRAFETATLFAQELGADGRVEEIADGLSPDDSPQTMADVIAGWDGDTMLVGHLPHIGRLTTQLIAGADGRTVAMFSPGTVACLERMGDTWALAWMANPELIVP